MSTITVTARRWSGGWELHFGDDEVTQVRTLDRAEQQVRDYLDTLEPDTDHSGVEITIVPELGALTNEITAARAASRAAADAQMKAAERTRDVVRALRADHLSVTDVAAILGVSRGRVSQIDKHAAQS